MRKEYRERALERYEAALASESLADEARASVHARLAVAYAERTAGRTEENRESAIAHFEKALALEGDPLERARSHHNLSIALRHRARGDRSENIERSIDQCRLALEIRSLEETPLEWSDSQRSVAECYLDRVAGDKRENIEAACQHYERALTAATFETDPDRWASIQVGLAAAYMQHPDRTNLHLKQSAMCCQQALRVITQETDPIRWRLCQEVLDAHLDAHPAVQAAEALAARLKARALPGDPFARVPDDMLEFIRDPKKLPTAETEPEKFKDLIEIYAQKIRQMVAEKLENPRLAEDGYLQIHVVPDWEINAQVATKPPYDIYVSTNLVRFYVTMSGLLIQGLGLSIVNDDGEKDGPGSAPVLTTAEVAEQLKRVIDAFRRKEGIPEIATDPGPAHYVFSFVAFFSTVAFLVSHEMGHVIFAEHRAKGQAPPFEDYASTMLEGAFENIIEGHQHPFDPRGLEGRDSMDLREVFNRWTEEITADILGASLTLEYQREDGPWAHAPDIGKETRLGIHIGFLSQMILGTYVNLMPENTPLISTSHPPMDFRTFCVLRWMYGEDHEEAEAPVARYVQAILEKLFESGPSGSLQGDRL